MRLSIATETRWPGSLHRIVGHPSHFQRLTSLKNKCRNLPKIVDKRTITAYGICMKEITTVFHDIRNGNRIFLCIASPSNMEEAAKTKYAVERELDPANCTPASIKAAISEMEVESGMSLTPSQILREEMGL